MTYTWKKRPAPDAELHAKGVGLLDKLRVPYDSERNAMWYDGHSIAAGPNLDIFEMLHEAGHWIMASPDRRKVVNYGLGRDPNNDTPSGIDSPQIVEGPKADAEEALASGTGILLVASIGGDYKWNLNYHNWSSTVRSQAIYEINMAAAKLLASGFCLSGRVLDKVRAEIRRQCDE